jgi:hypothetical protein
MALAMAPISDCPAATFLEPGNASRITPRSAGATRSRSRSS